MTYALVTGGAGFIGSHITHTLLKQGKSVRVFDNFSTGSQKNLPAPSGQLEVHNADLRDATAVALAVRGVQVVFHEAAFVSVPLSLEDPETCFAVNVQGTQTLLAAARQAGVRRVVLASSAAIYGDNSDLPLTERASPRSLSPYAASKQMDEVLADLYTRSLGLEVACLRYFNVFGPRQSPESVYAAAVPIFIRRMLAGQPVMVYGDGGQTRDLIYIADVVRANLLAAEQPQAAGQIFNVCTGRETRLLDLIDILRRILPEAPQPLFSAARAGDIYRSVGSPALAEASLGFGAKTSLADGLKETVEWMRH